MYNCIWPKSSNFMLKILLYKFSMCRHKLYQILSINKNVPCLVLLITGNFIVVYLTGQTAQVLNFSNSKVHHFKFIRDCYAKSMLAIVSRGLTFSDIISFSFFLSLCIFSALYNTISDMLLSLEL